MKKTKFYIGIALAVQAVTFFILFLVFWGKKKSLAKAFAAVAAAGGVASAFLLATSCESCCEECCDDCCEDDLIDEDDFIDDEIFCDFEEEELADEEAQAE